MYTFPERKTIICRIVAVACILAAGLTGNTLSAQERAPVAEMPSKENQVLIDSLLTISHYETFFRENCIAALQELSIKEHWSTQTLNGKIGKISLADFKAYTLYNAFAVLNRDQLEILIIFFNMLGRERHPPEFYIVHHMSEGNLKHYIKEQLNR